MQLATSLCSELPLEMYTFLAEYCDTRTCKNLTEACSTINSISRYILGDLLLRDPHAISRSLSTRTALPAAIPTLLDEVCNRLESLTLDTPLIEPSSMLENAILRCTALTKLSLVDVWQFSLAGLEGLAKLIRLKELNINKHPQLNNHSLTTWKTLNVRRLTLQNLPCVESDEWVRELLVTQTQLTSLCLGGIPFFTDHSLEKLTCLTSLESLHCDCSGVVDTGFFAAASLRNLTALNVCTQESLVAELIEPLRNHSRLQELNVENSLLLHDISAIASIKTLSALNVRLCSIPDNNFATLTDHTSLRKINASKCSEVATAACRTFASIKTLEEINLNGCQLVQDADLAPFINHPKLKIISLDAANLDGGCYFIFASIIPIEKISTNNVELKPEVLGALHAHPNIKEISIMNCRAPSKKEVELLFAGKNKSFCMLVDSHQADIVNQYQTNIVLSPILKRNTT